MPVRNLWRRHCMCWEPHGRRIAVLRYVGAGVCTQAEHYRIGRISAEKRISSWPTSNGGAVMDGALTAVCFRCPRQGVSKPGRIGSHTDRMAAPEIVWSREVVALHMELVLGTFLSAEK